MNQVAFRCQSFLRVHRESLCANAYVCGAVYVCVRHCADIPTTRRAVPQIVEKDTFSVNVDFTSKMTKLKIAQGVAKESPPERAVTQDRVDETPPHPQPQ